MMTRFFIRRVDVDRSRLVESRAELKTGDAMWSGLEIELEAGLTE